MNRFHYLIKDIKQGDETSFQILINHYLPLIYHCCKISAKTDETAEDLAQDIVYKIWHKIEDYKFKKGELSLWIITLIHNHLATAHRKDQLFVETREKKILFDVLGTKYDKSMLNENIDNLYILLPKLDYDILIYKMVYGFTIKQISQIFEITTILASKLFKKAREKAIGEFNYMVGEYERKTVK